jgi:hypothetical protein
LIRFEFHTTIDEFCCLLEIAFVFEYYSKGLRHLHLPFPIENLQLITLPDDYFDVPFALVIGPRVDTFLYQLDSAIEFVDRGIGIARQFRY